MQSFMNLYVFPLSTQVYSSAWKKQTDPAKRKTDAQMARKQRLA